MIIGSEKRDHNLKERGKRHVKCFQEKRGKEEVLKLYYTLKGKKSFMIAKMSGDKIESAYG